MYVQTQKGGGMDPPKILQDVQKRLSEWLPYTYFRHNLGVEPASGAMQSSEGERQFSTKIFCASLSLLLAFSSGLIYSCVTALVKYMKNIHPAQLVLYRHWAIAALVLPELIFRKEKILPPPGSRIAVFVQAVAAATSSFLHFFAFRFLPLGEAAVIISCFPATVTIAGKIFLKESFGLIQVVTVLITIIGMILVTGVHEIIATNFGIYTTESVYGIALALASVVFYTLQILLLRKTKHIHYSVLMFTNAVTAIVESAVFITCVGSFDLHYRGLPQLFIILIGFLSYLGLVSIIVAAQNMEVGPVAIMRASSDIFFSFLWQLVIFGDSLDGFKILGGILVCLSVALIGFSKQIDRFLPKKCVTFC